MITMDDDFKEKAKIKVIGVGGAGCNALNSMIAASNNLHGVEFIAVNTDNQSLNNSGADLKIQIGNKTTGGLGAGARPQVGEAAAEEDIEEIKENLTGADMVIITAGMGGGTGTGAAPVIARAAKEMGILTVSLATTPFNWEGPKRAQHAKMGIEKLTENSDSIIVISNGKIQESLKQKGKIVGGLKEGFKEADRILKEAVDGISSLIQDHGIINLDFSDLETTMRDGGLTYIGIGHGEGENKVEDAVNAAVKDILLDGISIKGAKNALIQVVLGPESGFDVMEEINLKMFEALEEAGIETENINGVMEDPNLGDAVKIFIIATRLNVTTPKILQTVKPHVQPVPETVVTPAPEVAAVVQPVVQRVEPVVAPQPVVPPVTQPVVEPVVQQVVAPKVEDAFSESRLFPKSDFEAPVVKEAVVEQSISEIIDEIIEEEEEIFSLGSNDVDSNFGTSIEIPVETKAKVEVEEEETLFDIRSVQMDASNGDSSDLPAYFKGGSGSSSGRKVDRKVLADLYDDRKSIPAFLRKMMD